MTANTTELARKIALSSRVEASSARVLIVRADAGSDSEYAEILRRQDFEITLADSLPDALFEIRTHHTFDLVLVQAVSGRLNPHEFTRKIKHDGSNRLLPIIVLLGAGNTADRLTVLRSGADDCLTEPFEVGELLQRCRNLIRNKRAADALEDSEKVIYALARVTEGRDKYTQGHVERVAGYAVEIGTRLQLSEDDIASLKKGGIVHDLGKIAVSDVILNKPGKLDDGEWGIMRTHPTVGFEILARLRTFHDALPIVRWHHERPNGRGYPDAIGGDELPLLPRIVAIADCFDALTTARSYHQARSVDGALEILTAGAEQGDFDPDVAAVLQEMTRESQLI